MLMSRSLRGKALGVGQAAIDPLVEICVRLDAFDIHVQPASHRAATHLHQLDARFEEFLACVWIGSHDEPALAARTEGEVSACHECNTPKHLLFGEVRLALECVSESIGEAFVVGHPVIICVACGPIPRVEPPDWTDGASWGPPTSAAVSPQTGHFSPSRSPCDERRRGPCCTMGRSRCSASRTQRSPGPAT